MENDKSFSTNYFTHDNSKDNYRAIEFSVFYLIEAADSKRNLISKLLQIIEVIYESMSILFLYSNIKVSISKCKGLHIKTFFHCLQNLEPMFMSKP